MSDEHETKSKSPFLDGSSRWIWVAALVALIAWNWLALSGSWSQPPKIEYSLFRSQLEGGNVSSVEVEGEQLRGTFQQAVAVSPDDSEEETSTKEFITYLPTFGDEELLTLLRNNSVEISTYPSSDFSWWGVLINFLPLILFFGLLVLLFRRSQMQGQRFLQMQKNRAKTYDREQEDTSFDDVAGLKGAKKELAEIVDFLQEPSKYYELGGEIPRGVLLVGPPGTGKTLLARAVAGEADVPFFSLSGSDFMEMFVGVGASRVRDLFSSAKKNAPAIVFIDELDSIGRRRGAGLGGGHDEREQTLNQLLSEMDGFEQRHNVIIMAATNRPDILDQALLRPGRFDRQISVDMPTVREREEILEIHSQEKKISEEVDMSRIAQLTPGFSGADLANLLNEAALLAARKDKKQIDAETLQEAKDKVMMGLARENLLLTDEEKELLAYHEAGHALVGAVLMGPETIHKVSIVPRGRSMGVTQQFPERDRYVYRKSYLLRRLAMILGGRASERIKFEELSTGAADDLKKATQLARKMILHWGMSDRLGSVSLGGEREQVFLGEEIAQRREYSETTAREVDEEVKAIIEGGEKRAQETLEEYREKLEALVEALLEHEEIDREQVQEILDLG